MGPACFCLGEFLRVMTHSRVFTQPITIQNALAALNELLQSPTGRLLWPDNRYWSCSHNGIFRGHTTGNVVFDARIVAVCLEHGIDFLISEDRGVTRFGNKHLQIVPIVLERPSRLFLHCGVFIPSSLLAMGSRAFRSVAPVQRSLRALPGIRDGTGAVPYSRFTADYSSFCDVEGGPSSGLG